MLAVALALLGLAAFAPAAFGNAELRVNTLQDRVDGNCGPNTSPIFGCSLREALELTAEGENVLNEHGQPLISGEILVTFDVTPGTIEIGDRGTLDLTPGPGITGLKIVGPGNANLTVNAEKKDRAFEVHGGNVTITGLTIAKGFEDDFAINGSGGGALYQSGGDVTLEGLRLTENGVESGRDGGAIDVEGGDLTVVGSVLEKNSTEASLSEASGGAINVDASGSTVTLKETEVTNNVAGEGEGGGIYQDEGNLVIEDSVISDNKAANGGGGIAAIPDGSHTTTIVGSTISNNSANDDRGGGILADTGSGGLNLIESTVSGNKASEGGGIAVEGPATVTASTISGNEASTSDSGGGVLVATDTLVLDTTTLAQNKGGALFADDGETQIRASTISANTNSNGEVGGIYGREEEATIKVRSSIVAGNTGMNGGSADCAGEITTEGHNIVGTIESNCEWSQGEGDQLGATGFQLGTLADNGGPTETMAPISATSIVINHGGNPKPQDQRNLPRPVPTGAENTDVGAVEVQAPVNKVAPVAEAPEGMLEGESIVCKPGTWDNDTITSGVTYSYAWFADNSPIGTESTYTLKAADANKDIACRVAANNGVTTSTEVESNSLKLDPGALSLTPSSHDFGNRKAGSGPSAPQSFTLKNEGGTAITVTGATLTPE
ncbi:MAG TPA: right-handed parallel beta-helix repeat-containing protein, partial [Solirubrobacterales bacterium]|nr:right-handed parallel beta-helix repeat-containing protein [Solirubrobacterales bacterium]